MSKIIGIDLGTTNSCDAKVELEWQFKLIHNMGGEFIIPSIFAIDDKGNELIGHEAKRQWQLNPRNTVYAAKRLVGRSFESDVVAEMQKSVAYEMRPGERNDVVLDVGKKHFRLAEISAKILNKIRSVAPDYLQKKHHIDLSTDPVAMQRIKDLAERVKIDLSSREQAPFNVPFVTMTPQGQPLNIDFVFTRKLLEELTAHLVDRTFQILDRVMTDAQLDPAKVDELLLVGGQTRMPVVQKRLTERLGKAPSKGVHPDEAVAIGAALYANSLEDNSNLRLQLLDVIPMAIGLEKAGGAFHVVFPRNAAIPNAKAIEATTSYDDQTEVAMRIFQGDHAQVSHNDLLGDFLFSGLRPAPAGKARLEITFDVNIEGILTMSARDVETGKQMKTTVRVTQH